MKWIKRLLGLTAERPQPTDPLPVEQPQQRHWSEIVKTHDARSKPPQSRPPADNQVTHENWSEAVKKNDARGRPAPPIRRTIIIPESAVDDVVAAFQTSARPAATDYLGQAAAVGSRAKEAARAGEFDKAWGLFHEQKQLYLCHAQSQGWSARHTLALDASVHEDLANILRLEKRHKDALPHIIYWAAANRHRPIKKHADKLRAYFNRCKLKNTTLEDVEAYLSRRKGSASYSAIQKQVKRWIQAG